MSSDGLRARWKLRRNEPSNRVELGAASANAYFTSKRIRQRVQRKAKPVHRNAQETTAEDVKGQERQTVEDEQDVAKEEWSNTLDLPSHGQMLAELRAVDKCVVSQSRHLEQYFPTWKSELLADYNLLFYGVGSKLALLQVRMVRLIQHSTRGLPCCGS